MGRKRKSLTFVEVWQVLLYNHLSITCKTPYKATATSLIFCQESFYEVLNMQLVLYFINIINKTVAWGRKKHTKCGRLDVTGNQIHTCQPFISTFMSVHLKETMLALKNYSGRSAWFVSMFCTNWVLSCNATIIFWNQKEKWIVQLNTRINIGINHVFSAEQNQAIKTNANSCVEETELIPLVQLFLFKGSLSN